ncbi:mediator of RNA polymerase II transcription subunit 13 isoform X2 [Nematostella vectensis]|uniref:mediator of RNA polymerase II transcription subunit 13 isoform X2 n=1 Tax=Nematostella vectensis TaxID=45351 RepID=UPI0020778604|nr:mediator of RNA polymerase II transcription subunit 13 isoform X2 [Nematostella vectensis]
MTTSSCVFNGADLDDCCSNVFALTDLCGLKWKKFVHAGHKLPLLCVLDDPILSSFSAALAQDILCSWRSISPPSHKPRPGTTKFTSSKEFWVFWYGDEPNLTGIVSSQLKASTQGCWEDGLPHEPRCMLFKALHNLLERCLLSKRFVRFGKWFLKPNEKDNAKSEPSDHLSFSFSFFVHGESSVCAAVEIQQHPQFRALTLDDLACAATKPEGLQVSLSPYGLPGFLTGHVYHADNAKTSNLLEEWRKFYPLDITPSWTTGSSSVQDIPAMVVVVHEDSQMIYPSDHVMVPCQEDQITESLAPSTDALQCASSSSLSLTPPASPSDPVTTDATKAPVPSKPPLSPFMTPSPDTATEKVTPLPKGSLSTLEKKKLTQTLVQDVWQDITAPKPLPSKLMAPKLVGGFAKPEPSPMPSPGGEVSLIGQPLWEFEEPFKRNSCTCTSNSNISRPKPPTQVRSSFGIGRPIPSPNHPLPSPQQQQQQQHTQTTMKLKKEKKKPIVPFHHRPLIGNDSPDALKCHFAMATKGLPTMNILTTLNQKRHSDAAVPYSVNKRYAVPGHTVAPSPKQTAQQLDSCESGSQFKLKSPKKENIPIQQPRSSEQEGSTLLGTVKKKERNPYVLPKLSRYVLPTLPADPLDSRPLCSPDLTTPTVLPSATSVSPTVATTPTPSMEQSVFWPSGSKRPSIDLEVETTPVPSKKTKKESSTKGTGPGRPRSDSSGSSRPRSRRSSSHQSPTVAFNPTPFTSHMEDMDLDPLLKSPPPIVTPKQRHHSSTSNATSPIVPSPASSDHPKPGRPRNRRQSSRKQQEEKERLLREQEEERLRLEQQRVTSFESSMHKVLPSPPTPRNIMPINLVTEKDLAVTEYDLDHIFDLDDEDDGGGGMGLGMGGSGGGGGGGVASSQSSFNKTADPYSTSATNMMNTGVVSSHDLVRMFPTPPSLEPMTHSPPCSAGSEYISPGSVKTVTAMSTSPDAVPLGLIMTSEGDYDRMFNAKELSPVFEVQEVQEFPLSSTFGPIENLPSTRKCKLKTPEQLTYKASWQVPSKAENTNAARTDRCISIEGASIDCSLPLASPFLSCAEPRSIDSKHYTALSPASPASSISCFSTLQLKQMPTRSSILPPKLLSANLPKANALTRVLALSDSNMNYFYDKNFDSSNLCVCPVITVKNDPKGKRKKGLSQRFDLKRCTCGYAAYELSKYSPGYGLFPEDEVSLAPTDKGRPSTMAVVRRPSSSHREIKTEGSSSSTASAPVTGLEPLFTNLVEIIVDQCSSPFSCSVLRYQMLSLGLGKNTGTHGKDSCGSGVSSVVSVGVLHGLRPLIQEALQKSTSRKTWEQPNGTVVQGPLSWKQLHNVAVKGVEESPKPQPIPSMRVGCGGDWMSLSPFAFQFWDKLLLEPFSAARDVAYVVVAPENESVISSTKLFFRELSSIYETCRLGQHVPISKLRDGILRVGQKFLKLSKESVDDWFTQQSTTVEGARLKLYAQVCRYQLAPYLSTLTLDRHLLDRDEKTSNSKLDTERSGFPYSGSEGSKTGTIGTPTTDSRDPCTCDEDSECSSDEPPTIVVYLLDPFSGSGAAGRAAGPDNSMFGLMRCLAEMNQGLSESVRNNVVFQVVPLHQVSQVDTLTRSKDSSLTFIMQLKCLAFSVFSRCRKTLQLSLNSRSLTGLATAGSHDAGNKGREVGAPYRVNHKPIYTQYNGSKNALGETLTSKLYSCPYILDTSLTGIESSEDSLDSMLPSTRTTSVLYCGYCLSRDQRWLLTSCTDGSGELMETTAISVGQPLRADGRLHKFPSRTKALRKAWEFYLGVVAPTLSLWRVVICKMGRMGLGELQDWKEILSKTSVVSRDPVIRDSCKVCHALHCECRPIILGASVMMLEPEPAVRLYMAKGLERSNAFCAGPSTQTPVTSIPRPDVSRTYISVFPSTYHNKASTIKHPDVKTVVTPEPPTDTVVTDTSILLAGADDDESDPDPLRHLFPLLNTSPTPLSPVLIPSPAIDENHLHTSSPLNRTSQLNASPGVQSHSPFQPISRVSPFQPVTGPAAPSPVPCNTTVPSAVACVPEEGGLLLPLAQGYFISTLHTGKVPAAFWAGFPQSETSYPVMLRAALYVHAPDLHEATNGFPPPPPHALTSQTHCDVLRYVLQRFDALSWLTVDPVSRDRRSCLPVHLCILSQLYDAFSVLLDST